MAEVPGRMCEALNAKPSRDNGPPRMVEERAIRGKTRNAEPCWLRSARSGTPQLYVHLSIGQTATNSTRPRPKLVGRRTDNKSKEPTGSECSGGSGRTPKKLSDTSGNTIQDARSCRVHLLAHPRLALLSD